MTINEPDHVVIIGAGIVGVSTAIWLRRAGVGVTVIDKQEPGEGTSFGNGGVLASCAIVPVTMPGIIGKSPKMLLDPNFPLFLRWSYLPKLTPWLLKYLSNANDSDTRRIAKGLEGLTSDSVDQHLSLVKGTRAEPFMVQSDYSYAYKSRAAFDADSYVWDLRREAGFVPELIEGGAVREFEPLLSPKLEMLAVLQDHGFVRDPGAYVKALAKEAQALGATLLQAEVKDFTLTDGRVSVVETDQGPVECSGVVLAAGVWSKALAKKLGLSVPLESERGYHIVFKSPSQDLRNPVMITTGKFVATPMASGMRCAGIVEFGGLEAEASPKPIEFLKRQVAETFPDLSYGEIETWFGHRPAPSDSLPLIGEIKNTGVFTAFGHHHVGLTSGPKTGRIISDMITQGAHNTDLRIYSPNRFAGATFER